MGMLNLLVLRADDPQLLAEFYEKLGLSFVCEQHGRGPDHYASTTAGVVLEIYPRLEHEPTTATRLGFRVADLDAVLESIATQVLSPPSITPWGRRAVIVDPEGHKVELLESPPSD